MRSVVLFCSAVAVSVFASPVVAAQLNLEQQRILEQVKSNPELRQAALQMLGQKQQPETAAVRAQATSATKGNRETPAAAKPSADKPAGFTSLLSKRDERSEYSSCAGLLVLLRQDWKDIGYVSCPDSIDKATGAQISFTDDRAANNRIWAAHGTAALLYNSVVGNDANAISLYDVSIGAYVTLDRALNSSPAQSKANSDTTAYGGLMELGFATPTGANYFRVRGGGVEDHIKNTTSANVTAEWLPVYYPLHVHEPFQPFGAPLIVRYDPVFLVQYATATGGNKVLGFNGLTEALRVGPQITVKLFPLPGGPDFLSRLSASLTYHWWYETYSRTAMDWFQVSLTYNLDKAGHIGWTVGYQRGRDENTGVFTDVYKVALTGKI